MIHPDTAEFPSFFCQVSETKVKAKACMPQRLLFWITVTVTVVQNSSNLINPLFNPQEKIAQ
jgi:pseudouridine-5'-phosphate glycosidase